MDAEVLVRQALVGLMVAAMLLAVAGGTENAQAALRVEGLRCEYLEDPLGIDARQPRLSWILSPGPRGRRQSACQVLVASSAANLGKGRGDLWDSGRVGSEQSTFVMYGGRVLESGATCFWKVRVWDQEGRASAWSMPASWSMGLLEASDWHGQWIGQARPPEVKEGTPLPFPWLRKTFTLAGKPERATAFVNPLGYYELYVNGTKVDDQALSPAVSDYSKRNLYVTHDVTEYLVAGKNSVGLWLGRGWYVRGHPGVVHDGPLARAQLEIVLPGGQSQRIGTDESWKVRSSPLTPLGRGTAFGDYGGERYDARQEVPGWNSEGLNDSGWEAAARFEPPAALTAAQMVEPNRITETLETAKVEAPAPGVYVFDMGRCLTGWFGLRLPAGMEAGKTVKLEYSDFPPAATRWRTHNQRDEVITDGREMTFRSRFNYHGFRWVRVTGLERVPSPEDARGYLIHTNYEPAGEFECSNDLLNRIHRLTTWTYRNLTLGGYVVDCPTRERLGYGGDAGTSLDTGMLNFAAGGLYNRWLANWRDAQHPETGDLPYTAPHYQDQGGGGPMWSGFVVTLPWQLYLQYGDRRALVTNYPMMRRWLAFLQSKTRDGVLEFYQSYAMRMPQWNFLGDWVPPRPAGGVRPPFGDPRSAQFINNCHMVYQLQLTAKIATVLGKQEDAAEYAARAAAMKPAVHARFYNPAQQTYATGEQPYLAVPLMIGMVPPDLRPAVTRKLEETIRVADRGHINAGMHGTYFLLKLLMEQDRNDLVYEMVSKRDFPGWGHMLEHGATTAWEDWDGSGSRIHDTLISVGAWFTQGIGGIRIDEGSPGFRHFLVRPAVVGDLTFARARYRSPYGWIAGDWRIEGDSLRLAVTVPPGATATVHVPTSDPASVTEGGRPAARASGVRSLGAEEGRAAFRVESGEYVFTAKRPI